ERASAVAPDNLNVRLLRAELRVEANDFDAAAEDLRQAESAAKLDARLAVSLAGVYARAGRKQDALRVLDALGPAAQQQPEVSALRARLLSENDDGPAARALLEEQLKREPANARLLARLCSLYRTQEPARAVEYCERAVRAEPANADFGAAFGAALVQARRFQDAASVLTRVVAAAPEHYEAHANLATALDKLSLFREALNEYQWLGRARPDLPVIHFFIARMHDQLTEYPEALAAYETFLAKADPQQHKFQIEQVGLRLPTLREQVKRGEGVKRKKGER
ncbi:MAG TPA: tetratricopeptide repeat protein, partial [Pyrinomonadaceae bacterium]|nr:tetratricopeptide repeat protein [Pyrinomonadaceae bacterium]